MEGGLGAINGFSGGTTRPARREGLASMNAVVHAALKEYAERFQSLPAGALPPRKLAEVAQAVRYCLGP